MCILAPSTLGLAVARHTCKIRPARKDGLVLKESVFFVEKEQRTNEQVDEGQMSEKTINVADLKARVF